MNITFISRAGLAILALLIHATGLHAQPGHWIEIQGGPQYVNFSNFEDYSKQFGVNVLNRKPTYFWAAGANYTMNFSNNYGVSAGLQYSKIGQHYSGRIGYDGNLLDTNYKEVLFNSGVEMTYIKMPLAFRMNSTWNEGDRIGMAISFGFVPAYLRSVDKVTTDPAPPTALTEKYANWDFRKTLHKGDVALMAQVTINAKFGQRFMLGLGTRFERSLVNIEKTSTVWPADLPVEYTFPLSTKKTSRSDVSRDPTLTNVINVFLSASFRIATIDVPEPQDYYIDPLPDLE